MVTACEQHECEWVSSPPAHPPPTSPPPKENLLRPHPNFFLPSLLSACLESYCFEVWISLPKLWMLVRSYDLYVPILKIKCFTDYLIKIFYIL